MWGIVIGLFLAGGVEFERVFFGWNLHAVLAGRVYRSAQLSPADLEEVVRVYGIRTVVNLRGCCDPAPWYLDECRTTHRLQVAQEDICLSAGRLPSIYEMRRLVEVLDHTEYPILLHCKRGADRTGMVSAAVLLLQSGKDPAQAYRQLGLRYGHLAIGRPAFLDQYLKLYADWLRQRGQEHSQATFRHWVEHCYAPGECQCRLEPLDKPAAVPRGRPTAFHVRCHNTGDKSWRLRAGRNAGTHAGFLMWDPRDQLVANDRAGLFDAKVVPGKSVDVTVCLPAVHQPGRYRLLVDMIDERQAWFYQMGSEPLELVLDVR
jgi:protein tyrosine phosphatase (PTP) superfamily phosphohydrolase (DUF442 family)